MVNVLWEMIDSMILSEREWKENILGKDGYVRIN